MALIKLRFLISNFYNSSVETEAHEQQTVSYHPH
jgi:hypothetical protein